MRLCWRDRRRESWIAVQPFRETGIPPSGTVTGHEPATDIAAIWRAQFARFNMPYQSEAHMEQRLPHLGSSVYAAAYTTYVWSQVIAKDMFTRFSRANLFDAERHGYRTTILEWAEASPQRSW